MAEDMQQDAIDCATQALEKYNIESLSAGNMRLYTSVHSAVVWVSQKTECLVPQDANIAASVSFTTPSFKMFY